MSLDFEIFFFVKFKELFLFSARYIDKCVCLCVCVCVCRREEKKMNMYCGVKNKYILKNKYMCVFLRIYMLII